MMEEKKRHVRGRWRKGRIVGSTEKEEENWKNEDIKKSMFKKPEKEELEGKKKSLGGG